MELNKKIVACRKKAGLSQEQLAEQLGVSRQTVSRWETGEVCPDTDKIKALCRLFHSSADTLLFEERELSEAAPMDVRREKRRFRLGVECAAVVLGLLLVLSALGFAYWETLQPSQHWITALGPFRTYLFASWRAVPFWAGILSLAAGVLGLSWEYRHLS